MDNETHVPLLVDLCRAGGNCKPRNDPSVDSKIKKEIALRLRQQNIIECKISALATSVPPKEKGTQFVSLCSDACGHSKLRLPQDTKIRRGHLGAMAGTSARKKDLRPERQNTSWLASQLRPLYNYPKENDPNLLWKKAPPQGGKGRAGPSGGAKKKNVTRAGKSHGQTTWQLTINMACLGAANATDGTKPLHFFSSL